MSVLNNEKPSSKNFYKLTDVYTEKFYQMPQVFFTSKKYKNMSNDAKVAYSLLKDRNSYSIANHWVDKEDNVFFIFTNAELMELLNCQKEKLSKIKKELISRDLLFQKRIGFNKPNRLYLLKPEVNAEDVYLQNRGSRKNELPTRSTSPLGRKENSKNGLSKNQFSALEPQESSKDKQNLNYTLTKDTILDTNRDTLPKKENQSKSQESSNENYFDVFSPEARNLINLISQNSQLSIPEIKKVIFGAKNKALYANGIRFGSILDIKNFPNFVVTTLRGCIKAMKSKRGVKNLTGYIYKSFHSGFDKFSQLYNNYWLKDVGSLDSHVVTEDDLMNIYRDAQTVLN